MAAQYSYDTSQLYAYDDVDYMEIASSTYTAETVYSQTDYQEPPLIPVKLDIAGLYETLRQKKKSSTSDDSAASIRRKAQNRASQRAFRDRKEKHVKDLEERIQELEHMNSSLAVSYEALKTEYDNVKLELSRLTRDVSSISSPETSTRSASIDYNMYFNEEGFEEEATASKKKGKK